MSVFAKSCELRHRCQALPEPVSIMVMTSTKRSNLHECNNIANAAARKADVGELLQCFPHTILRAPKRI
nr:hypothetical protein [Brucella intermedia]